MDQPHINNILRWGIENSDASRNSSAEAPKTALDPNAIAALFGGVMPKSDATVMKESMDIIDDETASLEARLSAFDDFELLVENLDNANNLGPLELWTRLVSHLDNSEAQLRKFAAWCVGTAVENNEKSQERVSHLPPSPFSEAQTNWAQLLIVGAIPTLVKLATEDGDKEVRKKAVRALSCASRNFQPALDVVVDSVPSHFKPQGKLDAADMDSVDTLINLLRADAERAR